MNHALQPVMIAAVAFCVFTETGREVCFKYGAKHGGTHMFLNPATLAGIAFWAVELLAWSYVLGHAELSVAFPMMALSYALIAIAGAVLFQETINFRHALGILLVTAGVVCVGASGL